MMPRHFLRDDDLSPAEQAGSFIAALPGILASASVLVGQVA